MVGRAQRDLALQRGFDDPQDAEVLLVEQGIRSGLWQDGCPEVRAQQPGQ